MVTSVFVRACSLFSHVPLFDLWTIARQAPLSMGFPTEEYWSGLPFPPPGHLPNPGIKGASYVPYIGRWILYQLCQALGV